MPGESIPPSPSASKPVWPWILLAVVGAAGGIVASRFIFPGSRAAPAGESVAAAAPARWRRVTSWSGSGMKNSEPFTIRGSQWKAVWTISPDSYGISILGLFAHRSDGTSECICNTQAAGTDSSFVYVPGEFYMQIIAQGQYSVVVSEFR